jgi:hypothetical protein
MVMLLGEGDAFAEGVSSNCAEALHDGCHAFEERRIIRMK